MKRSEEGLSVLRFRRFSTIHLLIALGLLFIAAPFVEEIDGGELIVAGLFPPVMLAVTDRKRVLVIAIVFAIHAITGRRINDDVAAFWLVEPTLSFVA